VEGKEEELKTLEEIKQKIGDKEQKSGLFQKLDEAAQKQMSVRRIALEDFSLAMDEKISGGKEMVMSDKDIKKAIGELDKDGKLISQSLNEVSKDDDLEKDKEEAEKTEENKEEKVANATAPKGGASIPADVAKAMQQMAGQQVAVSEEPVEPKAPNYADILGYDPSNALNYDSSMNILGVFMGTADSPMGTAITDDLRIELLNSPEGAKIVQQALMKINSQDELGKYNFFSRLGKKFNSSKMNKKVMAMIEKQLPAQLKEKADSISKEDKVKIQDELKKHGVDIDLNKDIESQLKDKDINSIENGIKSLSNVYDEKITELRDILKGKDLSDEDRKRYSQQLENITNKKSVLGDSIQKYVGLYKFNDIAKDAVKGEINQKYALNPESTIKYIPDDKPEKTFGGQNQVYSVKERTQKDIEKEKMAEEKYELDKEIQKYYDEHPNKDNLSKELQQKKAEFDSRYVNSIIEDKKNRDDGKSIE